MRQAELKRIAILTAIELRKEMDEIMTVEQVAEYLGIKPKTVHNKANNGELPHHKKFGRLYFSKQEITRYCLEQ
jgi:excisionase family DNA binding protein